MTSQGKHLLAQIPADVILIHVVSELAPHDDRHQVRVDIRAQHQRSAHGAKGFEAGAVPLQVELVHQTLEALANIIVAPELLDNPRLRIDLSLRLIARRPALRAKKQMRGLRCRRQTLILRDPLSLGLAGFDRLPNDLGQRHHARPPILRTSKFHDPAILQKRALRHGRAIIGSKAGKQRQQDLGIQVGVAFPALGLGNDLSQLLDRPRPLAVRDVRRVPGLVDRRFGGRIEVIAVIRGQHQLLLSGVIETSAHHDDVAVHGGQASSLGLAADLAEHLAGPGVVRARGSKNVQGNAQGDGFAQLLLQLLPALQKLNIRQVAVLPSLLLAREVNVDCVAERFPLPPARRRLERTLGSSLHVQHIPTVTLVAVCLVTPLLSIALAHPVAALMPVQREGRPWWRGLFFDGCANGCASIHSGLSLLEIHGKSTMISTMNDIPDKDEVGSSNLPGPISQNTGKQGQNAEFPGSPPQPTEETFSLRSIRPETVQGVRPGVGDASIIELIEAISDESRLFGPIDVRLATWAREAGEKLNAVTADQLLASRHLPEVLPYLQHLCKVFCGWHSRVEFPGTVEAEIAYSPKVSCVRPDGRKATFELNGRRWRIVGGAICSALDVATELGQPLAYVSGLQDGLAARSQDYSYRPTSTKSEYCDAAAIALMLGVTLDLIQTWVETGAVPHYFFPGDDSPRFKPSEVRSWIAKTSKKCVGTTSPAEVVTVTVVRREVSSKPLPHRVPESIRSIDGLLELDLGQRYCGIYFLCKGNDVVYVGQSVNVIARIGTHQQDVSKSFDRAFFFCCKPEDLDRVERALIDELLPLHNGDSITRRLRRERDNADAGAP